MPGIARNNYNEPTGNRLRTLRVRLGLDRHAMAKLLGMETGSYKQAELGYARLGRKRLDQVARLEAEPEYRHKNNDTRVPNDPVRNEARGQDVLDIAASLLADPATHRKILRISEIASCDLQTAARQFLEIEIKKRQSAMASKSA